MKVLISSKNLYSKLQEIDFETENIRFINLLNKRGELVLITSSKTINIYVEVINFKHQEIAKQDKCRWDWVKSLVSRVEEQPIVLEIEENSVNVIFQY